MKLDVARAESKPVQSKVAPARGEAQCLSRAKRSVRALAKKTGLDRHRWLIGVCAFAAALAASGCATLTPPKPWEKQDLARPEMQFDANLLESRSTQHIYQSKEGAAGGYGVGGGGCGCN